jgi:polysaccharide deacetylase 2 family uncharacterized protein YibQ
MKKKRKNNLLIAVLTALIVLSVAAIVYVIMFPREETVVFKSPEQKKQTTQQKAAAKEMEQALTPAKKSREKARDLPQPPPVAGNPAEKEDVVIAKIMPPRLKLKQVAIIIDDIGYDMTPVHELLRVDADITFAILPLLAHSREAADMLHKANRETLLHLPMEPLSYPKEKPGNGALFSDMNDEEIVFQLEKNLASVPYISGVNNHMGSKFMADEERLMLVFKQLKKKDLFFIDSRTTNNSKTTAASQKAHLTVASRKIFLDNDRDYSKIYQILMDVCNAPAGNAPLIVIGHPYPETIRAIRAANKSFREKGVSIVPVSKLVKKKSSEGAS